MTPSLYEFTQPQLRDQIAHWGFRPVHAGRLWRYLYGALVDSLSDLPELPPRLQNRLRSDAALGQLSVAEDRQSSDGFTRKLLFGLADGQRIETVLMQFRGRATACVSSQAGCALGCVFCATGQMGFSRNLTTGEIVAQAVQAARMARQSPSGQPAERLRNVVLMGMGETLLNYEAVLRAVGILRDTAGMAIASKRITLSTVGIVPGIVRLADERQPISLAVSLHAATQDERAAIVPIARAWPLAELMEACRYYTDKLGRRIFFEWTLIDGANDSTEQARMLALLLRGIPAQVNLIPLNRTAGYTGRPGDSRALDRFRTILQDHGLPVSVRQYRGIDIAAGCGQLAAAGRSGSLATERI